ncbi:non-ribosomal peptide synthetase, partial [Kordia periserrulae]|uniref:non-ribosomal peptide synthetase n=1 Tax=Kordia periserrulae TaxID=701523 RepID=UPI0011B1EF73
FDHQDFQYEELVNLLEIERDTSRNALFDVMFSYESMGDRSVQIPGLVLEPYDRSTTISKFDLDLSAFEDGEGNLQMSFEYATSLYNRSTIERYSTYYIQILTAILNNPSQKIAEIDMLSTEDYELIHTFSTGATVDYGDATVLDLFREMVAKKGTSTALRYEGETMSYKELDSRSDDLASYLIEKGILGEDKLVPISLDRGFTMVVGILGILKSGGAYVPIDPLYPASRKRYILENIRAKTILTTSDYQQEYQELGYDAFALDSEETYQTSDKIRLPKVLPTDTIYVLYTSGSTGVPKGVINTHEGLYNRLLWMRDSLCLDEKDIILQKTTFCFDVSFWELILPLVIGGEMVLARTGGEKDSEYLSKVIEEQGITLVHFVPSMLSAFLLDVESSFTSLSNVVCSGEALPESVVSSFSSKMGTTQLHNLYGPTEAAIDVTAINLSDYKGSGVPIGKPVSNTQIYILGENNVLQPIGVKGELCIGGVQVSKGYLHNEALTNEKYTNNPYGKGKLYRTGDVARWDANGNIEYLGREDSQIKLRG